MVKKRKSVLKSSTQVVDSPMKEPRIIRGNHLEKARNSLNEALDIIAKKEHKKSDDVTDNDVLIVEENDTNKRVKKNESKQEVKDSLVLKLRDRSIDLASFTNNSAMYSICRAWIKNDPLSARQVKSKKSENLERSIKSDNESSTIEDYVYKLPPPKSRPEDETDIIHRVPMNLPKDVISTLDIKTNIEEVPNVSELLNEHRKRWVCIRQQWIKFSNENEARYSMSKNILNSMLNKDNNV
ncbi:protein lin-37 homolog [Rhopalosiphum padi]|uniref:protein lin-37 homolog n=1 Tax=Rhopalosiphum padi TaxID=40932 RepID=UPI00298ECE11|nr:protein lin-37 homolog [Rhopalosiphum padi]XP_060842534.1 protein lin-37 homolog [Rhopalosiphum padi]